MKTFLEYILEVEDDELLRRFARRKKVDLSIDDYGEWLGIDHIHREPFVSYNREPPNRHTKGAGAKVMRAISKVADRSGKKVKLYPANSFLQTKYYPQFGYRAASYNDMDYGDAESDDMVRDPRPYSKLTAQQRYQRAEHSKKRKMAQQERDHPGQKQFNFGKKR